MSKIMKKAVLRVRTRIRQQRVLNVIVSMTLSHFKNFPVDICFNMLMF